MDDAIDGQSRYRRRQGGTMRTISIRQLTGRRLQEAADQREVLGVTSDHVLSAVLLPVERRLVEQLVERNLSEIVHGVGLAEKDLANGGSLPDVDSLLDAPQNPPASLSRDLSSIRPVGIRDLSAAVIAEACQNKQTIGITNNRQMVAVLIPVSQRWMDQIVQQNLSRLVKGVLVGEAEVAQGGVYEPAEPEPSRQSQTEIALEQADELVPSW